MISLTSLSSLQQAIQIVLGQFTVGADVATGLGGHIPKLTDELKRLTLGLSDADWSTLVVNKLHLTGILTPEDLVSQWKQNMTVLMPDVNIIFNVQLFC